MEDVRRFVRNAVGYDNPLYRAGAAVLNSAEIIRKEGFGMLSTIRRIESQPADAPLEQVKFRNLDHPIYVRPGTNDLATVIDTVVREEYGRWLPESGIGVLVDAGAFIGDTSAWYLSRYPQLRVWALEPMPANYELAAKNLSAYGVRAVVMPLALAGKEGQLGFGGGATGGSLGGHEIKVQATTVPKVLAMTPHGRIDILKIDIEGAELEVFQTAAQEWLPHVDRIIVELHGPEITKSVLAILEANNMEARPYRSVWYCHHKAA